MPISDDQRIETLKKIQAVHLGGHSGIVRVSVDGGPMASVQVAVLDKDRKIINGVGMAGHGKPLVTDQPHTTTSWSFPNDPEATYVRWAVVPYISGGGLHPYTVTAQLVDASTGAVLATGAFKGEIPDGAFNDDKFYDGVALAKDDGFDTGDAK